MGFYHGQQVVYVAIVSENLMSTIIVLEFQFELVPFLRLDLLYLHCLQAFKKLGNQSAFLKQLWRIRLQIGS